MGDIIDLSQPDWCYMIGLFQADGHLRESSRNRGYLSLEISSRDRTILEKIAEIVPLNTPISDRIRDTNFSEGYESSEIRIFDMNFRRQLVENGMIVGKKSDTISVPENVGHPVDYWRGWIDGDGSLGLTGGGYPFISLITKSESIKSAYCDFLHDQLGVTKQVQRNSRDNCYNLMITREHAQFFISVLYYPECLCLDRKRQSATETLKWERPEGMRRSANNSRWTSEQDAIILNIPIEESCRLLGRSEKSVKTRLWRLKNVN